jgi:hypothetical protein
MKKEKVEKGRGATFVGFRGSSMDSLRKKYDNRNSKQAKRRDYKELRQACF